MPHTYAFRYSVCNLANATRIKRKKFLLIKTKKKKQNECYNITKNTRNHIFTKKQKTCYNTRAVKKIKSENIRKTSHSRYKAINRERLRQRRRQVESGKWKSVA